jgi:hypothetical protein
MTDILTSGGDYIDLLNPDPKHLKVRVIAHALSNLCRFGGHCSRFYSVARHSVFVSYIVEYQLGLAHLAIDGLMHDGSEAFLGDVTSDLKAILPEYKKIEKNFEHVIAQHFGLRIDATARAAIKRADLMALGAERKAFIPPSDRQWSCLEGIPEVDPTIVERFLTPIGTPQLDRFEFVMRFNEVGPRDIEPGISSPGFSFNRSKP